MKRVSWMWYGMSLVLASVIVAPLAAQVGHPPEQSPYEDRPYSQELSLTGGYLWSGAGGAGVAPTDGALVGLRYEVRLGGPATFLVRYMHASTDRLVLDPSKAPAARVLGTESTPTNYFDVGFGIYLPGQRTWHNLTPFVSLGAGVVSDLGKEADKGAFSVGTPFAFNGGLGVRYAPGGRYALRLDVGDVMYKISYPAAYRAPPGGGGPIGGTSLGESQWLHHKTVTIGLSRLFGH